MSEFIYHLTAASEIEAGTENDEYLPARFEQDGFIHCTGDLETLVMVANDYFTAVTEDVVVFKIRSAALRSRLEFEAPAPIPGGGTEHLREGLLFPHIYGPLNLDAVIARAILPREGGKFRAPEFP